MHVNQILLSMPPPPPLKLSALGAEVVEPAPQADVVVLIEPDAAIMMDDMQLVQYAPVQRPPSAC